MVDIHTHVLPQVDDGSDSFEESLTMLRRASLSGVDTVVATPHWLPGSFIISNDERDLLVEELQQRVKEAQLPVKIVSGRECYFAPDLFSFDKDFNRFTFGNQGHYLLIESPMQQIPPYVDQMIFDIQIREITPIIAHVERYADVIEDPNIVRKFIEKGCIVQVNLGSVRGRYGSAVQETAQILLTHRLAHIVASDMHTAHSTPLGEGFLEVSSLVGEEEALRLMDERPRATVEGRAIPRPEPLEYRPKKPWWKLW